jgi:PST family polysaccharide transporter
MTTTHREVLTSNFVFLLSVQVVNYFLPLVTLPYLLRVLGPEKFGLIAFSQAFIQYFSLVTEYGFNLSAAQAISVSRTDWQKLSEIFVSVISAKFILSALSFIVLCLVVFAIRRFEVDWPVYLITFVRIPGEVLFPVWLFQGTEKMKYIAALNILGKVIFTVFIFVFVTSQKQYIYVPLINSLSSIVVGVIAIHIAVRKFNIKLYLPNISIIRQQFVDGWYIFIATVANSFYSVSNTFILGLFTNNTIVGYFTAGEKIIRAMLGLICVSSLTIYPYMSKLASESKQAALTFIRKVVKLVGPPSFLISFVLLAFAPLINNIIAGKDYQQSVNVIRILAFMPFVAWLGNIFSVQVMINFGLKKLFSKILLMAGLFNVVIAIPLVISLQHIGIAISLITTECFITVVSFFSLQAKDIRIWNDGA